jgi:acyl-CoA dehydrogenase
MLVVPMDSKGIIVKRALSVFGYDDAPHGHAEARPTNRPTAAIAVVLHASRRMLHVACCMSVIRS